MDNPTFMGTIGKWEYWIYPPSAPWPDSVGMPGDRSPNKWSWHHMNGIYKLARAYFIEDNMIDAEATEKAYEVYLKAHPAADVEQQWIRTGVLTRLEHYTVLIKHLRGWRFYNSFSGLDAAKYEIYRLFAKKPRISTHASGPDLPGGVATPIAAPLTAGQIIDLYIEKAMRGQAIKKKIELLEEIDGMIVKMELLDKLADKLRTQVKNQANLMR